VLPLAIVLILRGHLDMRPSVVTSGTLFQDRPSIHNPCFFSHDRGYKAIGRFLGDGPLLAFGLQSRRWKAIAT